MTSSGTKTVSPPTVVALGGGHGLAAVLKSVSFYTTNITGVVSVADDGGSSGQLRAQYGIPAPGDVRRCLSALASPTSGLLATHLEDRFSEGQLKGHPIGNLLLTSLALASDDFQTAIDELRKIVGVVGDVYPATDTPSTLVADSAEGKISGQVAIEQALKEQQVITNLRFAQEHPSVSTAALVSLKEADQIIFGPGDLLTSVLAAMIVPDTLAAIASASGKKIFVANCKNTIEAASSFQTDSVDAQLYILKQYGIVPDVVVCPAETGKVSTECRIVSEDILADNKSRHEPKKLARVLQQLVE